MPYKGEIGFVRLTNLMMNVFIGLVLGLTFLFVANDVSTTSTQELAIGFLQAFVLSVCVGYAMGDIIPTLGIAQKVCDALGLQSGFMRHLVTSLILSLVNVTVILCLCMFINIVKEGGFGVVCQVVVQLWPIAIAAGFLGIACTLKLAMAIASRLSGFDPSMASG